MAGPHRPTHGLHMNRHACCEQHPRHAPVHDEQEADDEEQRPQALAALQLHERHGHHAAAVLDVVAAAGVPEEQHAQGQEGAWGGA